MSRKRLSSLSLNDKQGNSCFLCGFFSLRVGLGVEGASEGLKGRALVTVGVVNDLLQGVQDVVVKDGQGEKRGILPLGQPCAAATTSRAFMWPRLAPSVFRSFLSRAAKFLRAS